MPPEASISGARTRLLAWVTLLSALWLSVCGSHGLVPSQAALDPVWLAVTKDHYRVFALEQGGACQSPVLDRLLDSRVEAKSDQRVILRVRYSYRQPGGEAHSSVCRGTGERVFRIVRRGADWRVAEMTGPGRLSPSGLFRVPFG